MHRIACIMLLGIWLGSTVGSAEGESEAAGFELRAIPQTPETRELELLRRDERAGTGNPKLIREGLLQLHEQRVFAIRQAPESSTLAPVEDLSGSDFYLVEMRFTLLEPNGNQSYQNLELQVELSDAETAATDFYPRKVLARSDSPRSLKVSPLLRLIAVDAAAGELPLDDFEPRITVSHEDERKFRWTFDRESGEEIPHGDKSVFFILRVPRGHSSASGALLYTTDVGTVYFKRWKTQEAKTSFTAFNISLRRES